MKKKNDYFSKREKYKNYILNEKKLSNTIKSISLLHTIKLHPFYLKLVRNERVSFYIKKIIKKLTIESSKKIIFFFQYIFSKKKIILNKDILIISHLTNKNVFNSDDDAYFGNLEKIFKKNKLSCAKIFINHSDESSINLNKKIRSNRLVLDDYVNYKTSLTIFYKKIVCIFEIIFLIFNKKINSLFLKDLLISLFEHQTNFALKMSYQIHDMIKFVKPKIVIFTYEGFSWERQCIQTIKKIDPNIKCIGYQHTIITDYHKSIFKSIKGFYNPDIIWSSHVSSTKILKKKIKSKKIKIKYFGNLKKLFLKTKKITNNNTFLILPEGIELDCTELFKFSLLCAKQNKNFKFIWRVHPVININKILKMLKTNKYFLPKNVFLSNQSFSEDLAKSSFIIYRGSSAVINGVLNMLYPIYYDINKNKNFDPLKNFFKMKNYASSTRDLFNLVKVINKKRVLNKKFLQKEILRIKNDLFQKPNFFKPIIRFI